MNRKIITILTTGIGIVFTAGLIMGFGGYVFAGDPVPGLDITIEQIPGGRVSTKNYSSSLSNKSIGQVRMEVGNVLLGYGFSGADINKVTEALEGGGVYEAELKSFFLAVGMNEKDTQNILLEFDKIGISSAKEDAQGVSTPVGGAVPAPSEGTLKDILPSKQAEPAPVTTPQQPSAGAARTDVKKDFSGLDSETRSGMFIKLGDLPGKQAAFRDSTAKSIQNLKAAESKEQRGMILQELEANRRTLLPAIQRVRESLNANAQELRKDFRENVKTTIGHVDHGKTGRIAVAHGKGLRMVNRYRSAMARFNHILGRMESRIEKIGIESEAQARARGNIVSLFPPPSIILLIEEAKNVQVENEAKLVELQAKYESLLLGENPQGERCINCGNPWLGDIAASADTIAQELKVEIEKLHAKLREIATVISGFTTPTYEPEKIFAK